MATTKQPTEIDATPYFFLIGDKATLGTPRGMAASEITLDISFHELAQSYELQSKIGLLSAFLIRPVFGPPICYPLEGRELIERSAGFLAAFCEDPVESRQRKDYLVNNGTVRVLIKDRTLLDELRALRQSETKLRRRLY